MRRTFVFSGGGALGAMQAGALRALLEHDVRPDVLVGCSVGALNASNLAREISLAQIDRLADQWMQVSRRIVYPGGRMSVLWRIVRGMDSLHDNRAFYQFLQDNGCTPALTFGHLTGARLYVTATHLRTGRLHVFGKDPRDRVLDALMASTALTPMHPPWEINGERYVDGGTVTPLPLRVALEQGATEIWALHLHDHGNADSLQHAVVDVRGPETTPTSGNAKLEEVHGVAGHINKAVGTMLRLQAEHDLHLAGVERRVKLHYVALAAPYSLEPTDFSHAKNLMDAGYQQMSAYLEHPPRTVALRPGLSVQQWWQSMWRRSQPAG